MGSIRRAWLLLLTLGPLAGGAGASDLELVVLDAADQPQAGVALRLLVEPDGGGAPHEVWRGETDVAGRARVPGPVDRVDSGFWRELATWHPLRVEILIPTPWPLAVRVPPERLEPGRPLRLGIPTTSRLRAHVIDRRGRPIDDAVVRLLGRLTSDEPWREMDERTTGAEGEVRFDHVMAGLEVLVFAAGKRGRWQPAETVSRAPARAGEEATVRLHFRAPNTVFRLRLVDVDGAPLAGRTVWIDRRVDGVSIDPPDVAMPGAPTRADEDGDVEVRLDRAASAGRAVSLVLSVPDPVDESRRAGPWARAVVDVTARLEPGRVALGEVVVAPLPRLAAGRVVDEEGAPIAKAVVVVYEDVAACRPARDALGPISIPHPSLDGSFLVRRARTKTREDGTFEVRGDAPPRDLWIVVRRSPYEETAAARLAPGDDGLRFVLRRAAK